MGRAIRVLMRMIFFVIVISSIGCGRTGGPGGEPLVVGSDDDAGSIFMPVVNDAEAPGTGSEDAAPAVTNVAPPDAGAPVAGIVAGQPFTAKMAIAKSSGVAWYVHVHETPSECATLFG